LNVAGGALGNSALQDNPNLDNHVVTTV